MRNTFKIYKSAYFSNEYRNGTIIIRSIIEGHL